MIDTQATAPAWPADDTAGSAQHAGDAGAPVARPPIRAEGGSVPRRANTLVAGLVKAMREAAIASREETSSRLKADATAQTELLREQATADASALRKKADEDVAGIREWSKAEIARVRLETDERIEARKAALEAETTRHAERVERMVEEVQTVVGAFEADMDRFFGQLLAETDPARLAALAEQAPVPPDLGADAAAGSGAEWADMPFSASAESGLDANVAAAAEAAAREGLDLSGDGAWPSAVVAARRDDDASGEGSTDEGEGTRLMVSGLTSVAGISAFKGALGALPGVHAVSVTSGDPGVFVFAVAHDPDVDLGDGLTSLTGFAARITDATVDGVTVVAHEPAA